MHLRAGREGSRPLRRRAVSAIYVARVRPGRVDVLEDGRTRVDSFAVPPGARLRTVLAEHGWRPTGRVVRGRGHDGLIVTPLKRTGE
jgi:hypothetical protein